MSDPLSITLVPGALPQDDEVITNSILRSIARPTVTLAGSIGAATIDDGAVTTAKIADGALTADATGRAKMEDGYVTAAKLEQDAAASVHQYAAGVYAAGVYAVTLSPARTGAYVAGEVVRFKADTANTGAADVNINARGAANLYKAVSTELAAGDIPINFVVTAVYDGSNFQVVSISPVTFVAAQAARRFTSSDVALATGAPMINTAHSLGAVPKVLRCVLVAQAVPEFGYTAGDEVDAGSLPGDDDAVFSYGANATNVWVLINNANIRMPNKSTGSTSAITFGSTKWKIRLYAEL